MSKKTVITNILMFAGGVGVGYAFSYFLNRKKFEDWANEEINSVKNTYNPNRKEGIFATPEGAVAALIPDEETRQMGRDEVSRMLMDAGYAPLNGIDPASDDDDEQAKISIGLIPESEEEEYNDSLMSQGEPNPDDDELEQSWITGDTIVQSIWDNTARNEEISVMTNIDGDDTFVIKRHADKPYIIDVDTYMEDDGEVSKLSLLYFEEDGQLVDDREQLIPNVEEIVGENNMHQFGIGSKDHNVVYIRNEKLHSDIEVIRDKRSYSEVILGVKPARENLSPRKMRDDDQ